MGGGGGGGGGPVSYARRSPNMGGMGGMDMYGGGSPYAMGAAGYFAGAGPPPPHHHMTPAAGRMHMGGGPVNYGGGGGGPVNYGGGGGPVNYGGGGGPPPLGGPGMAGPRGLPPQSYGPPPPPGHGMPPPHQSYGPPPPMGVYAQYGGRGPPHMSGGYPAAPLPPHMSPSGFGHFYPGPYPPPSNPMMYAELDGFGMGGMMNAMPPLVARPNEDMPIDRWATGSSCMLCIHNSFSYLDSYAIDAPVLTPFECTLLDVNFEVNPLLQPPPDNPSDRTHLQYSVLYPPNTVHRSDDRPGRSWSNGRRAPATFPRVKSLLLISHQFPWVISVDASNPAHGVTCGDIIMGLNDGLKRTVGRAKFQSLPPRKQNEISERYHRNRSTQGPGYELGEGIKRVDFLCDMVVWNGLTSDPEFVKKKMGVQGKGWKVALGRDDPDKRDKRGRGDEKEYGWPTVLVVGLEVEGVGMPQTPRMEPGEVRSGRRTPMRLAETDSTDTTTEDDR